MNIAQAITALYPNAMPVEDFRVEDAGDGPKLNYWNDAKLGPRPSQLDLARGWYLYSKQAAYGRMAVGMIIALRAKVPEISAVQGAAGYQEGYLAVLLIEIASNNNPTRIQSVKDERTKWINKKGQVDAVTLSASPTEQEYLTKADTLNAITY